MAEARKNREADDAARVEQKRFNDAARLVRDREENERAARSRVMIRLSLSPEPVRADGTHCPISTLLANSSVTKDIAVGGDAGAWIRQVLAQHPGDVVVIKRTVETVIATAQMEGSRLVVTWTEEL
jgi:hypothetical protein